MPGRQRRLLPASVSGLLAASTGRRRTETRHRDGRKDGPVGRRRGRQSGIHPERLAQVGGPHPDQLGDVGGRQPGGVGAMVAVATRVGPTSPDRRPLPRLPLHEAVRAATDPTGLSRRRRAGYRAGAQQPLRRHIAPVQLGPATAAIALRASRSPQLRQPVG